MPGGNSCNLIQERFVTGVRLCSNGGRLRARAFKDLGRQVGTQTSLENTHGQHSVICPSGLGTPSIFNSGIKAEEFGSLQRATAAGDRN